MDNNRTSPDHGSGADAHAGNARGANAGFDVVCKLHIAGKRHARCERHEITQYAIVTQIASAVDSHDATNANVAGYDRAGVQLRSRTDCNAISQQH